MVKTTLMAAVTALVLVACGSTGAGTGSLPSPSPSPSTAPGLGFDAVVTERNTAITIKTGQKLEVVFHARSGMTNWSNVRSSDSSVLTPIVNPAATAVRGVTLAAFQALAPGQAMITASAGADCSPGQACPMYAMLLSVTVTVS
ncbi:MAG TPA: hypothetical protein VLR46_02670 [Candidatus Dormibacteraeota bacterium]|nr:hypothetical protein [Candidatus Dormibacteraeota bacterium]